MQRWRSTAFFSVLYALILSGCVGDGKSEMAEYSSVVTPDTTISGPNQPTRRAREAFTLQDSGPSVRAEAYYGDGRLVGSPKEIAMHGADAGNPVTLNIVDLPISQAAKSVLGDVMGINYSIDPKVDGRMTIQTTKPVSRQQVVELFDGALKSDGAALVEVGGNYRIVPLDQANGTGALSVGRDAVAGDGGTGVQVVPLHFVAASEIKRILEPMAPKGGILQAQDSRHAIILSGTPQEVSAMLEAISVFDVDIMRGMSFAIVPVKTSEPDAIADDLRTVFSSGQEGALAGMVQFLPNKHLGAILVISSQATYLARAQLWIRRLDAQAQGTTKQLFTYRVQNRPAKELVSILQDMFSKDASQPDPTQSVAPRFQPTSVSADNQQQPADPFGAISSSPAFGVNGGFGSSGMSLQAQPPNDKPASPVPKSADIGDDSRLKIGVDDANNALLIMATPDDYRRIESVVEDLDVVPNQVLIEATIAEVTLNDELQFGLQWYFRKQSSTATFTNVATGTLTTAFPGFSYLLTAANTTATLQALNAITTVNVLSSPSLMVLDNKTATLQVGDQVPIATQSAVSTLVTGATVNSISYKDTGVILSVTPRVNENGRVLLDIEQEVSSVAQTTSSGIDSPTIQQRRVKTTVIVNDSEAVTLGGLIQNKSTKVHNQVPVLGDIPIVGNVFRQKDDTIAKTELIIMITPHVIRDAGEARRITDEYRQKLELYSPHPGNSRHFAQTLKRVLD